LQRHPGIHGSQEKFLERFPKTQINNHGNDEHGGIIWEWDPVRHRQVSKQLSPAFSGRALKAKEPTIHKYVDLFVERMHTYSSGMNGQGVSLPTWINWILERRIRRQGAVEHLDFFEQLIPADREPPKGKELRHLEQVAGQLLIAGYEPPSNWFYFTIYHLVQNRHVLDNLTKEIRDSFETYDSITASAAASLPYLTYCLKESLRFTPPLLTGMPVISPGAKVDGRYIPRGVVCQASLFSLARSPRNFHEPLQFRPERWITPDDNHPLYDPQFADDKRAGFQPFSQGPRMCAGKEIAWWQIRVFLAKVLWKFDLEHVPGPNDAEGIDGTLRGWAMYEKPDVRVRFLPAAR
ncbi:isotrichodermin C-15 hydroxylase, partial [Diaporthe helianthi]